MADPGAPKHTNQLIGETSPYLLQHAHNPVDWNPWCEAALSRARREGKPILLSIGYSACHWCHVMERESFDDEAIAELMNDNFVCIKVDREERPDLDEIYMAATVAMNGSGGWPMTACLTADGEPFFTGTYFPPEDRYGRPGFKRLLARIAELWRDDRESLLKQASDLTEELRKQSHPLPTRAIGEDAIAAAVAQLDESYDATHGGFGSAPKFPPSAALSLLLFEHARTGDARALEVVRGTLDAMKKGGIYDHIGGGFARYSTDEKWLVPHFEKMLYDNAQLARVYVQAFQVTGDPEYRRVATETLDYVIRDMQAEDGGYFSAEDADSEGVEGKFYVWTSEQVAEVLRGGEHAHETENVCAYYDVTAAGNWEGNSILHTPRSLASVASDLGVHESTLVNQLEKARGKLYAARKQRIAPLRDDKILVSWNALMIGAMADGFRVVRDRRYLDSAERAARYVVEHMRRPDGGLFRTARAGRAHLDAYLEDYAYLADALVDLYEAGGSESWLLEARTLAERMLADFADPKGGGFYNTAANHEKLLIRHRDGHDAAIPNANAVAARALGRLSVHFDRTDFRETAERALQAYGRVIERSPRAFCTALAVADSLMSQPVELVFVGKTDSDREALEAAAASVFFPNRVVAHGSGDAGASDLPLIAGKTTVGGEPALYICKNYACEAPLTNPEQARAALRAATADATRGGAVGRRVPGCASATGTGNYAKRHAALGPHAFALLGKTGLAVSRIGFGGYRVDDTSPEHRQALRHALASGINLIDTATSYTDGRSERLIGEVLGGLIGDGALAREEVVVVSKIGYVQGDNLALAKEREASGNEFPEMVRVGEDCWHCIHPKWLESQLEKSLERLGLERLDVCLLHNPEYFLSVAERDVQAARAAAGGASNPSVGQRRKQLYARMASAFECLERLVAAGKIGCYGVSSNALVAPTDDPARTDLMSMLAAAEKGAGRDHHFRVLQLPLNLLEGGAALAKTEIPAVTPLELAKQLGVAVLANRPLNALVEGALFRLADPPQSAALPGGGLDAAFRQVSDLEAEFRRDLAVHLRSSDGSTADPASLFNWGDQLSTIPGRITSYEEWKGVERHAVGPQIRHVVNVLNQAIQGPLQTEWEDWRNRYLPALDELAAAIESVAADASAKRASAIAEVIDPLIPETQRAEPLCRKAIWAGLSTPGVTSVLLGMRQSRYVDDAIAALGLEPIPSPLALYKEAAGLKLGS